MNSHSVLVSAGPACAKHWQMWGLFTVMCYSHQTRLVKSQHVALLLKHPGEPEHQADRACVSSSVSSFSSRLPGNPHVSLPLPPQKSYCIWVTEAFNPLCHSSIYQKPFGLVSGPETLSVVSPFWMPSQPACLHPDWPYMKARNQQTVCEQMFLRRLANDWSPKLCCCHYESELRLPLTQLWRGGWDARFCSMWRVETDCLGPHMVEQPPPPPLRPSLLCCHGHSHPLSLAWLEESNEKDSKL